MHSRPQSIELSNGLPGLAPRGQFALRRAAVDNAGSRFRLTLSFIGLTVYLWVIHSSKAPIAAEAIGVGLFGLLLLPRPVILPPVLWWFGAFLIWSAIGWTQSEAPATTMEALLDHGKLWLIFLVAANVAHSRRDLTVLMITWLGIFALYPVRGTLFNIVSGISTQGRYSWNFIFSNPNDMAALILPILAISISVLQAPQSKWIRLSALAGTIILPFIIFATQSRGGILALATMALLILIQHRKKFRIFAVLFVAGGVIALLAPPEVWNRLSNLRNVTDTETIAQADEYGSAEQRYEIWKVGSAIARDHPIFGAGLGAYPEVHGSYAEFGNFNPTARGQRDTHSTYLNVLAETGLPGATLLMGMLLSVLISGRKMVRSLIRVDPVFSTQLRTLLIGLVAFMQACIFATMHHVAFLYLYLAVVATAIEIGRRTLLAAHPLRRLSAQRQSPESSLLIGV